MANNRAFVKLYAQTQRSNDDTMLPVNNYLLFDSYLLFVADFQREFGNIWEPIRYSKY